MYRNVRGLIALLLLLAGCCAGFRISQPDSKLKQKILELQNFARTNGGVRGKRHSKPLETETEVTESKAELFGHKITDKGEEQEVRDEAAEDKLLNKSARAVKKRRRRRLPRRSYGYEAPQTSYEAPEVSTHRPSYPHKAHNKKKNKPFTSFRSISTAKATSSPSSYTTPSSYSAPSPPKSSYSSPSRKPNYSSKPKNSYKAPKSRYSSPPKSSYSSPPKSSYSSPPKSSYSSPSKSSYSSPPKSSYSSPPKSSYSSSPKSSYSSPPKPSYSSPKSGYSSPHPSYSGDDSSPSEYSYHYSVPETESQAWEERTGYTTQGSYSVLLPDGRTMTVTYSVPDSETGFLAEVTYDGEPRYPEDPPSYGHPGYTTHKREARIHGGKGEKHLFTTFKSLDNNEEDTFAEELGLHIKTNDDTLEHKTGTPHKDRKYPHFEEINTIHKIPKDTRIRFPSFESFTTDPTSVFGEFPNLNPRQDNTEDLNHEKQTQEVPQRIFLEPPVHRLIGPLPLDHEDTTLPLALPVPIPQKSYQTTFRHQQLIGPENQPARPEEPYIKTNIQPFIFFQSQDSETNVKTIDNVG